MHMHAMYIDIYNDDEYTTSTTYASRETTTSIVRQI